LTGLSEPPIIPDVHIDERGDVEIFAKLITFPPFGRVLIELFTQNVTIFFSPRGVVNLSHYGLHLLIGFIVAIIETNRIEAIAEIAQVSKQANGTGRPLP
jgi:hypothetical protein